MATENLDKILVLMFGHEGGYTDDPDDDGNWTGGEKNRGELKGTKFGISAASYPHLNIRAISMAQATEIYKKDYWGPIRGDDLPAGLDYVAFDAAVNSGSSRSAKWIQAAAGVAKVDGIIGPTSLATIAEADIPKVIVAATTARLAFMKNLKNWWKYGEGWKKRVDSVRASALDMAKSAQTSPALGEAEGAVNALIVWLADAPEGAIEWFKRMPI